MRTLKLKNIAKLHLMLKMTGWKRIAVSRPKKLHIFLSNPDQRRHHEFGVTKRT